MLRDERNAIGFTEQIRPDRIGQSWQQPFVRMRVHSLRSTDKNSCGWHCSVDLLRGDGNACSVVYIQHSFRGLDRESPSIILGSTK